MKLLTLFPDGKLVVNNDDDFQCPVYELWRLLEPVENNECDFSTANYYTKKQSRFKNFGSNVNMFMTSIMLDKPSNLRFENFSIFKRFVADEIRKYDKPYPYIEGLVFRVTKRVTVVMMEERERGDNKSTGFTFKKSFSLWLNGFTSFSVKPLRISSFLGFVLAVIGFIACIVISIGKILDPSVPAGYTSLIAVLLLIGGIIMIILGLIGEYIGRIYICLNNSPQYVIKDTVNIKKNSSESNFGKI